MIKTLNELSHRKIILRSSQGAHHRVGVSFTSCRSKSHYLGNVPSVSSSNNALSILKPSKNRNITEKTDTRAPFGAAMAVMTAVVMKHHS